MIYILQESDTLATTGNIVIDLLSGESIWLVLLALVLSSVLTWLLRDRVNIQEDNRRVVAELKQEHDKKAEFLRNEIKRLQQVVAEKDQRIDHMHELARTELRESINAFNVVNHQIDKLLAESDRDTMLERLDKLHDKFEDIRVQIMSTSQR